MISEHKNPIIIFGDNITAIGMIRGLRKLGVDIFIVSDKGEGRAKYSKYVIDTFILHPSDPDYSLKIIDWIKSNFKIKPVLMVAGNDDSLVLLSKEYKLLCYVAIPTFPDWNAVNKVINKEIVNGIADNINIPIIKTRRISSRQEVEEYVNHNSDINYPVFLKSSHSRQFLQLYGTKGVVCQSREELIKSYSKYDGFLGALLVQDFLPGDIDQISAVLLVLNEKSQVVAVAANDKIRAAKLYGSTTLSSSSWNQKMVEDAVKIAEHIGYVGFVGVQFKYDPRNNEFKFLEINGRFSVSVSLAYRCGINMAEMVYKNVTGSNISRLDKLEKSYDEKILLWFPLMDFSILFQKRFYVSPLRYLSALKGNGYIVEPFSWRDPMPLVMECIDLISMVFSKSVKKMTAIIRGVA